MSCLLKVVCQPAVWHGPVRNTKPQVPFRPTESKSPLVAQTRKNPPAIQEAQVQSPGQEDPLEKGLATHSSILAWRIPKDRGAWWAAVLGVTKSLTGLSDLTLFTFLSHYFG